MDATKKVPGRKRKPAVDAALRTRLALLADDHRDLLHAAVTPT